MNMLEIEQLSIFLENKKGRMYKALDTLAKANINIRALSIADTSDFGILRLIVTDPKTAKIALEKENFIVKIINVIGVELSDSPGGLSLVLKALNDNDINLEYLYAFTHEKTEKAILILHADDLNALITCLNNNNFKIVEASDVYNM
ncbi:MAG: ACT domain-containing protein [Methanobacteriaceae archaeon]